MIHDLSVEHHPISSLFPDVNHRTLAEYQLHPKQVDFFHEYGYLSGVRVLSDEQVEALGQELARLLDASPEERALFYEYNSNESTDPNHVLFHALGAWRIAPGFHDLLWHPAFTVPAAQLLGGSVRFWHDQLFCKPAHHGGLVAWHQDYSYWTRTQSLAHLTCWTGLDDSNRENGCLHYIARSHHWPDLPITGLAGDMTAINAVLNEEQRREFQRPVAVELKKGEASFHHPRLVHGSFANHSDHSRRATVINVMKDGVRSASNDPLLQGIPAIPAGEKVEGRFFPLLYAPVARSSDLRSKSAFSSMTQHNRSLVTGLTFVATLGGLLFGYDTAVISGAVSAIDANFIEPLNLSETARSSLSGWTVSSALFGCIIGAVTAGWLAKRLGRKGGLLVAGALFLLSAVGSAYPELGIGPVGGMGPRALTPFIFYRILCGVGVGIASMLSPLYIAEIAPSQIRGRLVSFNQLSIVFGMLLVYFVNWAIASQGDDAWIKSTGWRMMLASEAVPAALFAGLLLCVPDTPRWLVMQGRSAQALQILIRLLGHGAAQATVADIEASLRVQTDRVAPSLFAFGSRVVVAGITLSVFQQFVGINAVLYYAPLMFKNMGATTDTALWQTIIVGLANALSTIIAILTVDRWARKPFVIVAVLVMGVEMLELS